MALKLDFDALPEVTHIPSRVRNAGSNEKYEEVFKTLFTLVDAARKRGKDFGPVRVSMGLPDGATTVHADATLWYNAISKFQTSHLEAGACISTAGNQYDDKGKPIELRIYVGHRPNADRLAKRKESQGSKNAGVTVRKPETDEDAAQTTEIIDEDVAQTA